jgi:hypothetical protein
MTKQFKLLFENQHYSVSAKSQDELIVQNRKTGKGNRLIGGHVPDYIALFTDADASDAEKQSYCKVLAAR